MITNSFSTDFIQERNRLLKGTFPKLRHYCQQQGLEFEIIDMRWGVRDEAISYHLTSEICIQEIVNCQRISLGPTLLVMLLVLYSFVLWMIVSFEPSISFHVQRQQNM